MKGNANYISTPILFNSELQQVLYLRERKLFELFMFTTFQSQMWTFKMIIIRQRGNISKSIDIERRVVNNLNENKFQFDIIFSLCRLIYYLVAD